MPDWMALLPPAGSVLVAAVVAFVSWQQWRTAHNKLAIDLFDKRYALYHRLVEALSRRHHECHHYPAPFPSDIFRWRDFYQAAHDAKLLFGPDIVKTIDNMDEALIDLEMRHDHLLSLETPQGSLMDDLDFIKFNGAYNVASCKFERLARSYMMLGHIAKNRPEKQPDWER